MDEYLKLLVLSYFKQKNKYSIVELTKMLGISVERLIGIMDSLIEGDFLSYENDLLVLTFTGRLKLQNHTEDFYYFEDNPIEIPKVDLNSAWKLDQIYVPEGFHKKVKR